MYHLSSRHPISKDLVESLLGEAGGSANSQSSRARLSVRPTSPTRASVRLLRGEDEKSGKDKKSAGKSRAGRRRRRGAYAPPGAARATRASVRVSETPHSPRDTHSETSQYSEDVTRHTKIPNLNLLLVEYAPTCTKRNKTNCGERPRGLAPRALGVDGGARGWALGPGFARYVNDPFCAPHRGQATEQGASQRRTKLCRRLSSGER